MAKEQKSPGGLLVGETDKNGGPGIKVVAPEGNILMGGGELILTSDTGKSTDIHEFDGKKMTPCEIASELNVCGGGVKIPCHIAEPANTTDSKMEVGDVIKKSSMAFGGITEADESATSKRIAIENLKDQVRRDESMGVIDMYELAALKAGASVREVEQAAKEAKAERSNRKEVGTRIPSESNEDKLARLKRDLIRLQVVGEGDTHQAKVIKTKIQVLNKRLGNSMEKGGVAKDPYINLWNTYLRFVDGVDGIISEEGELPSSYFKDGVEDELNGITESTKTREDIIKNKDRIILNAKDLLDGVEGMTSTNRISEGRYFKKGAISAMNKLAQDSSISSMETGGKTGKGKFYKEVIDEDGTKWEVYSTSSSGKTNFDIYRNGEKQEYGAYKTTNIDPTIDQMRESEKRLQEFRNEGKSDLSEMERGGDVSKKVIRRNLPINKEYKLIDSFYTGGILENPMSCDNCNKPIANVAVIEDEDGKKFHVGMDCAETLASIKHSMQFNQATSDFSEANAIRAKVRNARKKDPNAKLRVENTSFGTVYMSMADQNGRLLFGGAHPKEFFLKHLPDLAKHISNPEKNRFMPRIQENYDFNFDFDYFKKELVDGKFKLPRYNGPKTIVMDGYKAVVSYGPVPYTKPDGTIGHNDSYDVKVYKDDALIGERSFYMYRDIAKNIIYIVNEYEFNNFQPSSMAFGGITKQEKNVLMKAKNIWMDKKMDAEAALKDSDISLGDWKKYNGLLEEANQHLASFENGSMEKGGTIKAGRDSDRHEFYNGDTVITSSGRKGTIEGTYKDRYLVKYENGNSGHWNPEELSKIEKKDFGSMEKGGQVEEVEIFLPESKNRTYDHFSKNDEPKYRMGQKVFTSYNGPALNGTIDRIWLQDKDISRPAKSTDWGYKWMYSLKNLSRPVDVTAFYEDDLYPSMKDMEDKVRHYTATMDDDEDSMARGGKTQLQIGIEVEKEHKDLYERVKKMFEKNGMKMPISENEFYKTIAKAHLREDKHYYDKLLKYVEGEKMEKGGKPKAIDILNDPSFRNISFISAGHMSKSAKHKKQAAIDKFTKAYDAEQKDNIKDFIDRYSDAGDFSRKELQDFVGRLDLIKDPVDEISYRPRNWNSVRENMHNFRQFVQRYLPHKYLVKLHYAMQNNAIDRDETFAIGGMVQRPNNWQVYFMDNDRQKKVIEKNLFYHEAVKMAREKNRNGFNADYELMQKK